MQLPIVRSISMALSAVSALDIQINKAQIKNLALIITVMIVGGTLCLSKIVAATLQVFVVNTLSHCFNYSGLDGHQLMKSAVRYAIRTLELYNIWVKLAIDDTMRHHSKFCKTIANVYWLFDHVINSSCNAKCIVFIYLIVNDTIRFPIGWRVFKKSPVKGQEPKEKNAKDLNGKKKWELALELVEDAVAHGLRIEVVLFDSWYCVNGMVQGLKKHHLNWISEVKSSQIAEFWVKDDNRKTRKISMSIAKLFETVNCICKKIELGLKFPGQDISRILYTTSEFAVHIKAFNGTYKLVRSIDTRSGTCKIFITNELNWEAQKILTEYSSRWLIEEFFKNAKGFYGLEKACIRSEQGGALALFLVSFVDLLLSIEIWKSVRDNPGKGQPTVSAIIAKAQEENLRNLIPLLEDSTQRQVIIDALLKQLQSKQKKIRKPRKALIPVSPPPPQTDHDSALQQPSSTQKDLEEPAIAA